jgi:hypothetical protein
MITLLCLSIIYTIVQWIRIYIKYKRTNKDEYESGYFILTYFNIPEITILMITTIVILSFIGLLITTYLP